MKITKEETAKILKSKNNILILTHQNPDGDTLGSAYALARTLKKLNKNVRVDCSDKIVEQYSYLFTDYTDDTFTEEFIVSIDIADTALLGEKLSVYKDSVDLAIDHHRSNVFYAKDTLLDEAAAATAEMIYDLINLMGIPIDIHTANALYTGISTDTGCFMFTNTTAKTHEIAAELFKLSADFNLVNLKMFGEKSKQRIELETKAMESIEYYLGERVALITITNDMIEKSGATTIDLDGVSTIPRQIRGVFAGITLKEKEKGICKISLRTHPPVDASAICKHFGGGGHLRAAGCTFNGQVAENKAKMIELISEYLD